MSTASSILANTDMNIALTDQSCRYMICTNRRCMDKVHDQMPNVAEMFWKRTHLFSCFFKYFNEKRFMKLLNSSLSVAFHLNMTPETESSA